MKIIRNIFTVLLVGCCLYLNADELMVAKGRRVKMDYNLLINSEPVETTQGKEPLEFMVGGGNIIPGLENQMMGMKVGDERKIIVDPKDAYGQLDPNAFKEVPRSSMPADAQLKPGVVVEVEDPKGGTFPGVVWEVKDQSVVLNFNHPMAGQTLEFDVKVVDIQ
jgi:FKBP-type peptidyl-prolyl cis-trans isomerase SlyD